MPKVGKKSFPYTEKGVSRARKEASKTGHAMEQEDRHYQKFAHGGSVEGVTRGGGAATRGLNHQSGVKKQNKFSGGGSVKSQTRGGGKATSGSNHQTGVKQARSLNPTGENRPPQEESKKSYGKGDS